MEQRNGEQPVAGHGLLPRAQQLLRETPLIDGHNDFPYMIRAWYSNQFDSPEFNVDDMPVGHTDIQRLRKGMLGGQFWSAYVPCPKVDVDTNVIPQSSYLESFRQTIEQLDVVHSLCQRYPETFGFADSSTSISSVFRSGRIASLIGVEGLHQICNSVSALRMLHRLGVRYVTLSHNCNNEHADAAMTKTRRHGGLSTLGEEILREMNAIGMIIDLSHTSDEAQRHAIRLSKAPVIFSHSSSYTLCPHPRNVTDEVLDMLKENDGVIMVCFLRELTDQNHEKATLSRVADHIEYIGRRIGYAHVGIGSDFDGMLRGPDGLEDTSKYPYLICELLRRGIEEGDVKNVMGLNVIRVVEDVEKTARAAQQGRRSIPFDEVEQIFDDELRAQILQERVRGKEVAVKSDRA